MAHEPATLKGVIHGKTIELVEEPGLPDGAAVNVTLAPANGVEAFPAIQRPPRGFGAWAEDAEELDKFLAWTREMRKTPRREIEP
jgi:hypothetical protein